MIDYFLKNLRNEWELNRKGFLKDHFKRSQDYRSQRFTLILLSTIRPDCSMLGDFYPLYNYTRENLVIIINQKGKRHKRIPPLFDKYGFRIPGKFGQSGFRVPINFFVPSRHLIQDIKSNLHLLNKNLKSCRKSNNLRLKVWATFKDFVYRKIVKKKILINF